MAKPIPSQNSQGTPHPIIWRQLVWCPKDEPVFGMWIHPSS